MQNTIISEGKTTNEAIENGLKQLNVSKNMVNIKVLENEEKRSFFNILAPRVVKVELTLKENADKKPEIKDVPKKEVKEISIETLEKARAAVQEFLSNFLKKVSDKEYEYSVKIVDMVINVDINGIDSGFLIGHRGDVLNALQTILTSIANKESDSKIRVILDIENYRSKRKETLENLANKLAKTVLRTGKPITLEPMSAYERKIIHTKLQENKNITTHSIGEEPNRKIVISKIK